jgi:catechol 2,3-dioxygenase-like lactoylglutathione lyase family enzyme
MTTRAEPSSQASRPALGITKISHVLLHVTDLERARRFYCDFLGMEVRGSAEMADGRPYLSMTEGLGITTYPADQLQGASFDHVAFRCPNGIDAVVQCLEAAGVPYEAPRRTPYGLSVYFRDPDGNRIECHDSTGYP